MKRTIFIFIIATTSLRGTALAQSYDLSAWDCELLKSNPAHLDTKDAVRQATKKVMPQIPDDARIKDARVTVAIVVDADGSVQCVHAKQGHPLLISSCIQAAKDWRFKPYRVKGHPSPFIADLVFHFANSNVAAE
jgi:Gram-negative bacterial TonB protein C-terminal